MLCSRLLRDHFGPPLWRRSLANRIASIGPAADVVAEHLRDSGTFGALLARLGNTEQAKLLTDLGVEKCADLARADRAELPPPALREMYHGEDHAAYWLSGLGDAQLVRSVMATDRGTPIRLLDLGCSSGRLLRHLATSSEFECYGCDINAESVDWVRRHLPHVLAFTSTVLPHLPVPDGRFDVICALSVFTHIDEFEEAWLLEISRALRPGGVAIVSIHSDRTWSEMLTRHAFLGRHLSRRGQRIDGRDVTVDDFASAMPGQRVVVTDSRQAVYNTNVFHHLDYVQSRWSRVFERLRIIERAHGEHQDIVVMTRGEHPLR